MVSTAVPLLKRGNYVCVENILNLLNLFSFCHYTTINLGRIVTWGKPTQGSVYVKWKEKNTCKNVFIFLFTLIPLNTMQCDQDVELRSLCNLKSV